MFGIIPFRFRFRGRIRRLFEIYLCFLDQAPAALHPAQIAKLTGIPFITVNTHLESLPELFVKLPRRSDGLTRYRLTSAATAQSPEEVEKMLVSGARRESLLLWTFGLMILCLFVIVFVIVSPIFQ